MNDIRKSVIITYCIIIFLLSIYVPWKTYWHGSLWPGGYHVIWAPPQMSAMVDNKVILEIIAFSVLYWIVILTNLHLTVAKF
jgi:hypothetical protein